MLHMTWENPSATLILHGDITVDNITQIQSKILEVLPQEGRFHVEIVPEKIDSSFVQLAIALAQEAVARGIQVDIHDTGVFRRLCQRLGAQRILDLITTEAA